MTEKEIINRKAILKLQKEVIDLKEEVETIKIMLDTYWKFNRFTKEGK